MSHIHVLENGFFPCYCKKSCNFLDTFLDSFWKSSQRFLRMPTMHYFRKCFFETFSGFRAIFLSVFLGKPTEQLARIASTGFPGIAPAVPRGIFTEFFLRFLHKHCRVI